MDVNHRMQKLLQNEKFTIYVTRAALRELQRLAVDTGETYDNFGEDKMVYYGDDGGVFMQAHRYGLDECEIIEDHAVHLTSISSKNGRRQNLDGGGDISVVENIDIDERNNANNAQDDITARMAITRLLRVDHEDHDAPLDPSSINPQKYFLATQDEELANHVRTTSPNIPLLRINQSVLLLESPSSSSRKLATKKEIRKQSARSVMTAEESLMVQGVKEQIHVKRLEERERKESEDMAFRERRRKSKPRGPNPLSCKKKKNIREVTDAGRYGGSSGQGNSRKRKRSRSMKESSDSAV